MEEANWWLLALLVLNLWPSLRPGPMRRSTLLALLAAIAVTGTCTALAGHAGGALRTGLLAMPWLVLVIITVYAALRARWN